MSAAMDPNNALDYLQKWRAPEFLVFDFCLDLTLVLLFTWLLGRLYVRCGRSLSPRAPFAGTFPLLGVATFVVISVVKSSLALSLGLVGALSIIRFRAAIKEPEEQVFLFLAIAMSLGLGANQRLMTLVAFAVVGAFLLTRHALAPPKELANMHVRISGQPSADQDLLAPVVEVLKAHCASVILERIDDGASTFEAMFRVRFAALDKIQACRKALRGVDSSLQITLLEHQPIF